MRQLNIGMLFSYSTIHWTLLYPSQRYIPVNKYKHVATLTKVYKLYYKHNNIKPLFNCELHKDYLKNTHTKNTHLLYPETN